MAKVIKTLLLIITAIGLFEVVFLIRASGGPAARVDKNVASPKISRDEPSREGRYELSLTPPLIPLPQQKKLWH